MRTNKFIQNTDYILLASDGSGEMTLTIPAGVAVNPNTFTSLETETNIGESAASPLRSLFTINSDSNSVVASKVTMIIPATPSSLFLDAYVQRSDFNMIKLIGLIYNGSNLAQTTTTNTTIKVKLRTFKTPFSGI